MLVLARIVVIDYTVTNNFPPLTFPFVSMATGGRHIQTRLIEPKTSLMNSGDVFVLVTPKYVHQWNGKNCSIMEKARVCIHNKIILKLLILIILKYFKRRNYFANFIQSWLKLEKVESRFYPPSRNFRPFKLIVAKKIIRK